jgi:hypothetical protein
MEREDRIPLFMFAWLDGCLEHVVGFGSDES